MRPTFVDTFTLAEDDRIKLIGETCLKHKALIGFVVESGAGKAERYIEKLQKMFPGIRVVDQFEGPMKGMTSVRIAPPKGVLQ